MEISVQFLEKLEKQLPYKAVIPLLGVSQRTLFSTTETHVHPLSFWLHSQ